MGVIPSRCTCSSLAYGSSVPRRRDRLHLPSWLNYSAHSTLDSRHHCSCLHDGFIQPSTICRGLAIDSLISAASHCLSPQHLKIARGRSSPLDVTMTGNRTLYLAFVASATLFLFAVFHQWDSVTAESIQEKLTSHRCVSFPWCVF